MKQYVLHATYPVFTLELGKDETPYKSVDDIIAQFKLRIAEHKSARFIAIFDHFSHTMELDIGEIAPEILDAKNIIFSFGIALPSPTVMAVRPRSIGVIELADKFVINFLEAPMPLANSVQEEWALSLCSEMVAGQSAGEIPVPVS